MTYPDDFINKIICGDCLEILPLIPDKSIDLVITDPPYGVGMKYEDFTDSKEELKKLIDNFMPEVLRIGKVVLLTPGNGNQTLYPQPNWTLAWFYRGGGESMHLGI